MQAHAARRLPLPLFSSASRTSAGADRSCGLVLWAPFRLHYGHNQPKMPPVNKP
jgi:hypothetical protein